MPETFLSNLIQQKNTMGGAVRRSQNLWQEIFGATNKEDSNKYPAVRPTPGGSFGRSSLSSEASFKRLLQAFRSMAPGGWSDDRYEESRHLTDVRYVCIHRMNELLSMSELKVFIKDKGSPDGKRLVTEYDPPQGDRTCRPYDLVKLLEEPNNDDSFGNLLENWNTQLDLTGMALTWLVPNKLGTPYEMYPIPTALAIPQPAINPDYPNGYYRIQPIYPYGPFSSYPTPATAVGAPIPAEWMIRIKYVHPLLRYDGYSPQTGLKLHLDSIEQMDRSRWYTMLRVMNPSAILNFDNLDVMGTALPEAEIERIRTEFENDFQGPQNAGRLYVATPGSKLEPWTNQLKDLEYSQGWEQLVSFAMAGMGISKEAAGMVGSTAYSVLYAAMKQLHLLTLRPKCHRIANQLTRHLAPFFGDNLIVEVECERIDDHEIKRGNLGMLIQGLAITKNELRKELDMALTKEPWGDEIAGIPPAMPGQGEEQAPGMPQQSPADDGTKTDFQKVAEMAGANGEETPYSQIANGEGMAPQDMPGNPEPEVAASRPTTGRIGRGSLGPRKSLVVGKRFTKSFYQQAMEVLQNGHVSKN